MTKNDVLCKAIATATGETETKIQQLLEVVYFLSSAPGLKVEISDDRAARLLEAFGTLEGKRAIQAWLLEGRKKVLEDLTEATPRPTKRNQAFEI